MHQETTTIASVHAEVMLKEMLFYFNELRCNSPLISIVYTVVLLFLPAECFLEFCLWFFRDVLTISEHFFFLQVWYCAVLQFVPKPVSLFHYLNILLQLSLILHPQQLF